MNRLRARVFLMPLLWVGLLASALPAQETPGAADPAPGGGAPNATTPDPSAAPRATDDAAAEREINEMRAGLVDAFNKRDVPRMMSYCHPDIVVTWANAEVSRGPAEVRAYYERMMTAPDRVVESLSIDPKIEGRRIYGGTTSISYGTINDVFQLRDGEMDFRLDSRFSAALIRGDDGKWLVKGCHFSANVFDNPIQRIVQRRTAYWTAGIAAPLGVVAGFLLGHVAGRRRRNRGASAAATTPGEGAP